MFRGSPSASLAPRRGRIPRVSTSPGGATVLASPTPGALVTEVAEMKSHERLMREAEAYYRLCDRAQAVGVPTSLDDRSSPTTVASLRAAVERAERARRSR